VPARGSATREEMHEELGVDHLDLVVPAVRHHDVSGREACKAIWLVELGDRPAADHVAGSAVACHCCDSHALPDDPDCMVLGVRDPYVAGPVHSHVVGRTETGIVGSPVNESRGSCRASCHQADVPVGVYPPDLVVADIRDIQVPAPVAGDPTRILEASIIGRHGVGAVVAPDPCHARIGGNIATRGGLDDYVLLGVRAIDVA